MFECSLGVTRVHCAAVHTCQCSHIMRPEGKVKGPTHKAGVLLRGDVKCLQGRIHCLATAPCRALVCCRCCPFGSEANSPSLIPYACLGLAQVSQACDCNLADQCRSKEWSAGRSCVHLINNLLISAQTNEDGFQDDDGDAVDLGLVAERNPAPLVSQDLQSQFRTWLLPLDICRCLSGSKDPCCS